MAEVRSPPETRWSVGRHPMASSASHAPKPANPCRGVVGDRTGPQALWIFSSDACGVYGLSNIRVVHAGRADPTGIITLASDKGKLYLRSGTAMLLRVQSS